jgi:ribose transport system substrate-binding protein
MEEAAKDAEKSGLDVKILTKASNNHGDANEQIKNIENMILRKVNAIVIAPSDVDPLIPVLKKANEAEIPVIIVNLLDPIEGVEVDSYIGYDNVMAAQVTAYSVLDALGGPGVLGEEDSDRKVPEGEELTLEWWENLYKDVDPKSIQGKIAILSGIPGSFYDNERQEGFSKVIDQYTNVKIVRKLPADWNRQKGVTAAENILQNYKDLDGIWAASNEMGLGAMNAVKNMKREGEVFVATNDGTPESVEEIREGRIISETWHGFPEWGWYGVKFGVMLHLGEEIPEIFDIRPRTEYKGNTNAFYPNPELEAIDWEEIIKASKSE